MYFAKPLLLRMRIFIISRILLVKIFGWACPPPFQKRCYVAVIELISIAKEFLILILNLLDPTFKNAVLLLKYS